MSIAAVDSRCAAAPVGVASAQLPPQSLMAAFGACMYECTLLVDCDEFSCCHIAACLN